MTIQYGLIAGSGLDALADAFDTIETTPFERIPGVGGATVAGHRGEVRRCRHAAKPVVVVCGRRHLYEGNVEAMRALVGHIAAAGVTDLIVTSAAGIINTALAPGDIVRGSAVLDLQWRRPGTRVGAPARAERPPDGRGLPAPAPDPELGGRVEAAARDAGVSLKRGVIACLSGPTFETAAEVRLLQSVGADLATMSSAPELAFALERGLRVCVLATATNPGTGLGTGVLHHADVMAVGGAAAGRIQTIVAQLVEKY